MATLYRGIGKVRAHGKARIAITLEARDEADFLKRWHPPVHDYPFEWERDHRFCIEYQVEDFAAEVGFYIDILGITVDSISPSRAQFSSPDQELVLAISALGVDQPVPQPHNLRLQMFIQNIEDTVIELERRGVVFDNPPEPSSVDPDLLVAVFQTPNSMTFELWGFAKNAPTSQKIGFREPVDLDEEFDESFEDDAEDQEEYLPPAYSRPISHVEAPPARILDDILEDDESDDDLQEEDDMSDEELSDQEDQLELEIGYDEEAAGTADLEQENEDDEARLDRLLEASRRPAGYTFDERVEPVSPAKTGKNQPPPAESIPVSTLRSGRKPAGAPASSRARMLPARRTVKRPSPPVVEPTYDDIDEGDSIP